MKLIKIVGYNSTGSPFRYNETHTDSGTITVTAAFKGLRSFENTINVAQILTRPVVDLAALKSYRENKPVKIEEIANS
jgi:hypothetical protein